MKQISEAVNEEIHALYALQLAKRLRAHVVDRGGTAKDADGKPVLPNGAWQMMLDAADEIERLRTALIFARSDLHAAVREINRELNYKAGQ